MFSRRIIGWYIIMCCLSLLAPYQGLTASRTKSAPGASTASKTKTAADRISGAQQSSASATLNPTLAIEKLHLKNGRIHVTLKNRGTKRLAPRILSATKLKLEMRGLKRPLEWSLNRVDPTKRLALPGGTKEFDTGKKIEKRVRVTAVLYHRSWKTTKQHLLTPAKTGRVKKRQTRFAPKAQHENTRSPTHLGVKTNMARSGSQQDETAAPSAVREARISKGKATTKFRISDLILSETHLNAGDRFSCSFSAHNQGETTIAELPYKISLVYLDRDSWSLTYKAVLHTGRFRNMKAGARHQSAKMLTVPEDFDPPVNFLYVDLDPEHLIQNNAGQPTTLIKDITVIPILADLAIKDLRIIPAERVPDRSEFEVAFTVQNLGARTSGPCQYKATFLHEWEGLWYPESPGASPKVQSISELAPGQSKVETLQFTMPIDPTRLMIKIELDHLLQLYEEDENNNVKELIFWEQE